MLLGYLIGIRSCFFAVEFIHSRGSFLGFKESMSLENYLLNWTLMIQFTILQRTVLFLTSTYTHTIMLTWEIRQIMQFRERLNK